MRPVFPSFEIRDGLVYKRGEPVAMEIEGLKTCLAASIGERTGRFAVPRLVVMDRASGMIATEFIPGLKDLDEVAMENPVEASEVFWKAGRALATVHQELRLPQNKLIPVPPYLMADSSDNVALHGDYFFGNVCYFASTRTIVLLDWATAPPLGCVATYGPRYFDLLWFSWSLFFWTPPRWILRWRPERLVTALISGYIEIEPRFEWERYKSYRALMRPLLWRYWTTKRHVSPSSPQQTCAQLLGHLRWLLFPLRTSVEA